MADGEVKQKKRKISDVFKKKNKDNKEELKEEAGVLDVKETAEEKKVDDSDEKSVESADVQDSHERKKKKFGHRRFLPSRKKKSKKQFVLEEKREVQSPQGVKDESLHIDGNKAGQLEDKNEKEEEFVKEKGNEESAEDNSDEFTSEVQNVQLKCDSPEAVNQSDSKEITAQTIAINVNENNEQLKSDVLLKEESQSTEEGSVIRALLRQDVPTEEAKTDEDHDSTKHGQDEQKCDSNDIARFVPNVFIANLLDMIIPGSKSNNTGSPSNTNTETVYKLVLQTADQTYSTLVNLINTFLTRAGQIPKQAFVNFLVYLIKKYPQCFKIKKVKRKEILPDGQVPVDTVN